MIVVVDGSTDATTALLGALEPRFALTVVEQARSGVSAARNAGAARASGRLLLFVDDDEEAEPGLVAAHLAAHRARTGIVAIGAIRRRVPANADRLARLQAAEGNIHAEELARRPAVYHDFYGGNVSLRRQDFDEAGGFATDLARANDVELGYRLYAKGLALVFVRDAVVVEYRTRSWRAILADTAQRGRISVELCRRHPEMISSMQLGGWRRRPASMSRRVITGALLAARVPPLLLGLLGQAVPGEAAARAWFELTVEHAFWSGVRGIAGRELWRRLRSGTIILGYRAFGTAGERPSRYVVPARRFAGQLWWLQRRGYNVIALGEYLEYRSSHRLSPPRTVVITIEGGYLDAATVARPILERFGFRATLLPVSTGGENGRTAPALLPRDPIAPADARDLLGETFELLEQAAFPSARDIEPGFNYLATDSSDLRRTEVGGTDSLLRFAAMLMLGDLRRRPARTRVRSSRHG